MSFGKEDAHPQDPPILTLDAEKYDFGTLLTGEAKTKQLKIQNTGGEELKLLRFEFSCGCTIPMVELSDGRKVSMKGFLSGDVLTLKPGEWAALEVEFSALSRKKHVFYKMDIFSNDPKKPKCTVPLIARVQPAFTLRPKMVRFGAVARNARVTRQVEILSAGAGDFRIERIRNLPPQISYTLQSIDSKGSQAYRMDLTLEGSGPLGSHYVSLVADVKSERSRSLAIPISFTIESDVVFQCDQKSLRESTVDFGVLTKGQSIEKKVHILNRNPKIPYNIMDYQCVGACADHLALSLKTLHKGVEYELSITVDGQCNARALKGVITLISDHPDLKTLNLRIRGMYR